MTLEINKKSGFYGAIKKSMGVRAADDIWRFMIIRLRELYPEYNIYEMHDMLNSCVGQDIADHFLDVPYETIASLVKMQIAVLSKLNFDEWWDSYNATRTPNLDMAFLYQTAIKSQMHRPEIQGIMCNMLGCGAKEILSKFEVWLKSKETTVAELQLMWSRIETLCKKSTNNQK